MWKKKLCNFLHFTSVQNHKIHFLFFFFNWNGLCFVLFCLVPAHFFHQHQASGSKFNRLKWKQQKPAFVIHTILITKTWWCIFLYNFYIFIHVFVHNNKTLIFQSDGNHKTFCFLNNCKTIYSFLRSKNLKNNGRRRPESEMNGNRVAKHEGGKAVSRIAMADEIWKRKTVFLLSKLTKMMAILKHTVSLVIVEWSQWWRYCCYCCSWAH